MDLGLSGRRILITGATGGIGFETAKILADAGVRLTITAPMEALAAADELFAHFAPELAREAA